MIEVNTTLLQSTTEILKPSHGVDPTFLVKYASSGDLLFYKDYQSATDPQGVNSG